MSATELVPISAFYVSPGGSSERVFLYYAEVDASDRVRRRSGPPRARRSNVAVGFDELLTMVADGTVADAKTIIGALWLERRAER